MLVSHRHRFIYTKTGKTAGTSVELYFEPFCMEGHDGKWTETHAHDEYVSGTGIIGFRGPKRPPGTTWWNHMPAAEIKRLVGNKIWNSYFKFCVIRDPFDRAISLFFYLRRAGKIDIDQSLSDREQFEQWLLHRRLSANRDRYVIDGKFCLDDVIRYERLHADMERVCQRLNVPWNPSTFPHAKTGFRPPGTTVASMFSKRGEEVVRKQYAFEFEFFGYADRLEHAAETAVPDLVVAHA